MKTQFAFSSIVLLLITLLFNNLMLFIFSKSEMNGLTVDIAIRTGTLLFIPMAIFLAVIFSAFSFFEKRDATLSKKKLSILLLVVIGATLISNTLMVIQKSAGISIRGEKEFVFKTQHSSPIQLKPIRRTEESICSRFKTMVNDLAINNMTILKNIVTSQIISFLFLGEMIILMLIILENNLTYLTHRHSPPVDYHLIRPLFFIFMFGIDFSISFIPLHMETLLQPIFGLSRDTIISLPVSGIVCFTGIGFILGGILNDKNGWHRPFLIGMALAATGSFYSCYASNAYNFICAQCIVGLGHGIAAMASQGFIMNFTDARHKAQGFATLFAAFYAGGFCGSSTGAMLSESIGYRNTFFIAGMIIFSGIVCTVFLTEKTIENQKESLPEYGNQSLTFSKIIYFFSRKNVMAVILFSSIPTNLTMVGFLNYFNPVFLSRLGIPQSDIGRTFMIYSAFAIYFGPIISKHIDQSDNKKGYMLLGGVIASLTFFTFILFEGLMTSVIAISCLGIAHSFIFVAQSTYLLKLNAAKELGAGTALALYRSINRIGQMAGPILFSNLILGSGIIKGMIIVGGTYLFLTVLLSLFCQNDQNRNEGIQPV